MLLMSSMLCDYGQIVVLELINVVVHTSGMAVGPGLCRQFSFRFVFTPTRIIVAEVRLKLCGWFSFRFVFTHTRRVIVA